MSTTAAPVVPAAAAPAAAKPAKKARATKPKKATAPADHPKYGEMIVAAIKALHERGGSSRQAIIKYIMAHYNVGKDAKTVALRIKGALRFMVKAKTLQQAKASFRMGEKKKVVKKPKAKKVKKPKVKKVKKVKKAAKKTAKPKAKKATKKPKTKAPKKVKAAATKKPKVAKKAATKAAAAAPAPVQA